MTANKFINAIRKVVFESAVSGTVSVINKPPGRNPPVKLLAASKWYAELSENDKQMFRYGIAIAAHQATFGMLAVLDGVRPLENSPANTALELYYCDGDERTLLNAANSELLHDLFNQAGMPY